MNTLFYGDNIDIMANKMSLNSVDLVYLDPPFNSCRTYNLLYRNMTGYPLPEQAEAFFDAWTMDEEKEALAKKIPVLLREIGVDDEYVHFWNMWLNSLRRVNSPLMAYLIYMIPRLCHMKKILKPTGSIYLHCDPTASHYLKIMMDGIFGHNNFRNEIIWKRRTGASSAVHSSRKFGAITDTILFYSMSNKSTFNPQYSNGDASYQKYIEKAFKHVDEDGRKYQADNLANPSPRPNLMYEYKGYKPPENGWAISLEKMEQWDKEGRLAFPKSKLASYGVSDIYDSAFVQHEKNPEADGFDLSSLRLNSQPLFESYDGRYFRA